MIQVALRLHIVSNPLSVQFVLEREKFIVLQVPILVARYVTVAAELVLSGGRFKIK